MPNETAANLAKTAVPEREGILLLGNYRPARIAACKLHELGYAVVLGLGGGEGGVEYSRYVSHSWDHPDACCDPNTFLKELNRLLKSYPRIGTILPITEEYAVFFAGHSKRLSREVIIASPKAQIVETFWDKLQAYELAGSAGVPCLPIACVETYEDLAGKAAKIGFPLIVRPLGITARLGHKKAEILSGRDELEAVFPQWPAGQKRLLLQRYAEGARHNVYFAAHNGELIGAVESRILRTDHPDGTGLATDGRTVELSKELVQDTQALVAATAYTGIGLTQFIFDPATGERCFLELNPRVTGSHAVPEAAGLPLTELAVALANRQGSQALKKGATRIGMRYGWMYGDIRGLKSALMAREIGVSQALVWLFRLLATTILSDVQMGWSWRDPLPEFALFGRQLPGVRKLAGRLSDVKTMRALEEKTL